ncbi:MAG: SH3 domain-containing protein, partial [Planctomycetota bacterium]
LAAALLLAFLAVPWVRGLRAPDGDPLLVIRSASVSLRSEPDLDRPAIGALDPAAVVERIDALPGWVRVETSGGERGWVQEDAVFPLRR